MGADSGELDQHSSHGLRHRTVRGGTLAMSGYLGAQAISLVTFVVLARLAPPATFGAYAAASILLGLSALYTEGGMQAAVIHERDRVDAAASTALAANVIGGFCLTALAAAAAPLVGLFFHSFRIGVAAALMAGIIVINAASIAPGAIMRRRVSGLFPFIEIGASAAYGVVAVAALASGLGLWGLVLATYANAVVRTAMTWSLSHWRPSFALVSWGMWRSLSRYGRPVVYGLVLGELGSVGSTALVGRVLGTGDLGRFRAAQRFVLQANTAIIFGGGYALLPAFARIWPDEERLQRAVRRSLHAITLIVFPISAVFVPLGQPIAVVLLGERWRAAGPIMMAMAGIGIALALDSISVEAFKATGRTDLVPRYHGLLAIAPLPLMVALIHFGAVGIGLGQSLGMCAIGVLSTRALARLLHLPFRALAAEAAPATASAVVMAVSVLLLDRGVVHAGQSAGWAGLVLLALDLLAAGVVYLGSLAIFSHQSLLELIDLAKLLVRRPENSKPAAA
jgi:PST family polysaccharide transporter